MSALRAASLLAVLVTLAAAGLGDRVAGLPAERPLVATAVTDDDRGPVRRSEPHVVVLFASAYADMLDGQTAASTRLRAVATPKLVDGLTEAQRDARHAGGRSAGGDVVVRGVTPMYEGRWRAHLAAGAARWDVQLRLSRRAGRLVVVSAGFAPERLNRVQRRAYWRAFAAQRRTVTEESVRHEP